MDQKRESGRGASNEPAGSAASPKAATPRQPDSPGGSNIDFHSAEFNRTDDLNDYSGNYRSFQSLEGVITADMRHQRERRENRDAIDSRSAVVTPVKKIATGKDAAEAGETTPPLTVISTGRTLIIARDAERAIACGEILSGQGLTCTLLAIKEASPDGAFSRRGGLAILEASGASITGAFGGFSATVTVGGQQKELTEWFDKDASAFDLVLDLQFSPSFAGDRLPTGYYAPGADPASLDEAMRELPEMRGRFQKPQFNDLLGDRCIHGRSRTRDCNRCVAVCPFGAVQSKARSVSINHYLCQGCGGCALVCPTGAIRRVQPPLEEMLGTLQGRLKNQSEREGHAPTLVISGRETPDRNSPADSGEKTLGGPVRLEVDQIGHVGMELLLAAVASGAGGVVVVSGPQDPPTVRKAVEWQTRMAGALVQGFGMPEDKIRFAVVPPENGETLYVDFPAAGPAARPGDSPKPSPAFPPVSDRRALIRLATEHLSDRSGVRKPWLPLPAGSPFGAVTVDSAACTLCMACAGACPSGALIASGDLPRLEFLEARCHQCGLCEEACPEDAIGLLPRMLCDHRAAERPAVLHEVEPFRCIECGVPFATRAMIDRMKEKLVGHWMYADDRQLRRLQMCGTCRTRDALTSQDMKSWSNS